MQPRSWSEYSLESLTKSSDKRKVTNRRQDLKNRGRLYRLLFSRWSSRLAIIPAFLLGFMPVLMFMMFGNVLNSLNAYAKDPSYDALSPILTYSLIFGGLAVIFGLCNFLTSFSWIRIGSRFTMDLRCNMFDHMMESDVTFFDTTAIGTVLTLISEDAEIVQDCFGQTKGTQINQIGQFLIGIVIVYVYSWRLGLLATVYMPWSIFVIAFFATKIDRHVMRKFMYMLRDL